MAARGRSRSSARRRIAPSRWPSSWTARNMSARRRRAISPAGVLGRAAAGRLLGLLLRPLSVPLRGRSRQAGAEGPFLLPLGPERHSRRRDAPADPVLGRRRQGPAQPPAIRRADRDQPRQDLRAHQQGLDRDRLRRRPRHLGPEPDQADSPGRTAPRRGLHPLRRHGDHRLAGLAAGARALRRARWCSHRREGRGALFAARRTFHFPARLKPRHSHGRKPSPTRPGRR